MDLKLSEERKAAFIPHVAGTVGNICWGLYCHSGGDNQLAMKLCVPKGPWVTRLFSGHALTNTVIDWD